MNELRRARPLLGTFVDIHACGYYETSALSVFIDEAFHSFQQVQSLMSLFDPNSDVCRLNQQAIHQPVQVHEWTWYVLKTAHQLHVDSAGTFDPAVGATLAKWGYRPNSSAKFQPEQRATMKHVVLSGDRYVTFTEALSLDLGGIAKGFAVDQAVSRLSARSGLNGSVNAGGDVRLFGGVERSIKIRDPGRPGHSSFAVKIKDRAMATSGTYFTSKSYRGRRVSHLVNTASGHHPIHSAHSISVLAPTCMMADALTKPGFTLPKNTYRQLLVSYDSSSLIIDAGGRCEEIS